MFMGSLRSSPAGSRAGDDDDDDDEEALMLGERVGGVQGVRVCSDGSWRPSLLSSFSSFPPSPDRGSLDGDSEGLRDSPGVEVVEATAARRLARRGVRRTLLLSVDMALRLALRPLSPLPCLEIKQSELSFLPHNSKKRHSSHIGPREEARLRPDSDQQQHCIK